MEILKNSDNLNIVVNGEQNFRSDLGWQDNLAQFEDEILKDIINPSKNYETVRYIHKPYDRTISGVTLSQTDIWFQFYFSSGSTYVLDYNPVGISTQENELLTRQATESFFRLEFYKTPGVISNYILTCEPPTRQNRRLINSKNLSLPLGEKYFHTGNNYGYYIHVPVFTGSNYRNKENMYLFWFDDESVLTDTNLSGTTTLDQYVFGTGTTIQTILFTNENNEITQVNIPTSGTTLIGWTGQTFTIPNQITYNRNFYHGMNTFFMTAKFFNADRGEILDFINSGQTTSYNITEEKDMYYQIDFDNFDRTYQIYRYTGTTKLGRIGTGHTTTNSITFYEKGGGIIAATPTPTLVPGASTPTPTPTPTSSPLPATSTPTPTLTLAPGASTPTPTPTATGSPITLTPSPSPSPSPTPTPIPGAFGYDVLFGTYVVTSIGFATLSVQNTTSTDKYLWLRFNSGSLNTGTFSGGASITTSGYEDSITISGTITQYGQTFDGGSSLYLPAGSTYTINVVKNSPSAGSIYLTYTDVATPTKTNILPL
jgi:hypothetical protein